MTKTEKQALTRAQRKQAAGKPLTALEARVLLEQAAPTTEAAPAEAETPAPRITVSRRERHEQRLNNPFGAPSFIVPLKGAKAGWKVRSFTADPEHPNRHYDAVHRLNYEPLTREDLAVTPESLGFVVNAAGYIVRGRNGEEVLMAIPEEEWAEVQAAKARRNSAQLKAGVVRNEVSQAAAKTYGDEAGDQVHSHFSQREIEEPV